MQAERMVQHLRRFVRVEGWDKTHWLSRVAPPAWHDEIGPTWRLSRIQRALGMIEITPQAPGERTGQVLIGSKSYDYEYAGKELSALSWTADEAAHVSIWPTFDEAWRGSKLDAQAWSLKTILISAMRQSYPQPNRVEVMGLLNHVWRGGFELKLYVQAMNDFKYVRWVGDYPEPDDIGQFVYVCGHFDPAQGSLSLERTHKVQFIKAPHNWRSLRKRPPEQEYADQEPDQEGSDEEE